MFGLFSFLGMCFMFICILSGYLCLMICGIGLWWLIWRSCWFVLIVILWIMCCYWFSIGCLEKLWVFVNFLIWIGIGFWICYLLCFVRWEYECCLVFLVCWKLVLYCFVMVSIVCVILCMLVWLCCLLKFMRLKLICLCGIVVNDVRLLFDVNVLWLSVCICVWLFVLMLISFMFVLCKFGWWFLFGWCDLFWYWFIVSCCVCRIWLYVCCCLVFVDGFCLCWLIGFMCEWFWLCVCLCCCCDV